MKKNIFIVVPVIVLLFLCSCSKKENMEYLEFPKTTWGMSMEETLDSYGIAKEEAIFQNESGKAPSFAIEGYELFGENTSKIIFNFIDLKDNGKSVLCDVKAIYPENADMGLILGKMQKMYGETVSEFSIYDGYQVFEDSITEIKYKESEHVKLWAKDPIARFIPEKDSENYKNLWKDFQSRLNDDNWETFSQNARMVTVIWSNDEEMNMLSFDAYNLIVYHQLKSQLSE